MKDSEYIKMCNQDFSMNSRQSNSDNTTIGLIICGCIIITFLLLALFVK